MHATRRTGLALVVLIGLLAAQAPASHAAPLAAAPELALPQALVLGVDATADLGTAHAVPAVAATKLPGPKECSFVPSRNAVKPKKNACRFA